MHPDGDATEERRSPCDREEEDGDLGDHKCHKYNDEGGYGAGFSDLVRGTAHGIQEAEHRSRPCHKTGSSSRGRGNSKLRLGLRLGL